MTVDGLVGLSCDPSWRDATATLFRPRSEPPPVTRVCLLGKDGLDVRYELLSRETARAALSTYDLSEPYQNTLAMETVSLGAAVSLLNDLDWYLSRFVAEAFVADYSVADEEWLSRALAERVRAGEVEPMDTAGLVKVYGLADGRLVDPMFLTRTGGELPEYDLRDVEETVRIRVTRTEFEG